MGALKGNQEWHFLGGLHLGILMITRFPLLRLRHDGASQVGVPTYET